MTVEYELGGLKSHCSLLSVRLTTAGVCARVSAGATKGAEVASKKACRFWACFLNILRRGKLLERNQP